jgi:hypothetical protein
MPARCVIGTNGRNRARPNPDYTRRPDLQELLSVLSAMDNAVAV